MQYQVSEGKLGPVKDDESRLVPIVDSLRPVLRRWREVCHAAGDSMTDEHGLCFPPDPLPRRDA